MKKYYYNGEEEAMGPYTRGQIFRFLEDSIITPELLVFREDDANWAPIEEHPDFQDAETDPPEPEETDLPEPSTEEQISTIEDQAKLDKTKTERFPTSNCFCAFIHASSEAERVWIRHPKSGNG